MNIHKSFKRIVNNCRTTCQWTPITYIGSETVMKRNYLIQNQNWWIYLAFLSRIIKVSWLIAWKLEWLSSWDYSWYLLFTFTTSSHVIFLRLTFSFIMFNSFERIFSKITNVISLNLWCFQYFITEAFCYYCSSVYILQNMAVFMPYTYNLFFSVNIGKIGKINQFHLHGGEF